jgi:hypothetical protein
VDWKYTKRLGASLDRKFWFIESNFKTGNKIKSKSKPDHVMET